MATAKKWANVAVAMQSVLAATKTITAITKASPGVVTSTAHGYANGSYVLLSIQGMSQLDNKVGRVANQAANTFELEGIDTTLFDTFSSGTAALITFGTTLSSVKGLSASGGDFDFLDTTTIHGAVKTQIPGLPNPLTYSFDNLWDISDAAQTAMKLASDSQAQRAFRVTFGTGGNIMVFSGYVGFTGAPTGNALDIVTTPAVITMYGTPTFYTA
jgi:hypothetical protein